MAALRALESFARTGSVTETGGELSVSQSAVSRQLKVLEEYLDSDLFVRDKKSISLTPGGQSYADDIRIALDKIGAASLRLKANPVGGQLNLAVLPAFGACWLAPKLPDFVAQHPQVTVNLSTRLAPFHFANEEFHGAIHFGKEDWPDVAFLELMKEYVVPVASSNLKAQVEDESLRSILSLPLLHLDTRPNAWETWATLQGAPVQKLGGMLLDQFASMVQAAVHGMGAALLPTYLIERELAEGKLFELSNSAPVNIGSYYFVWPVDTPRHEPTWLFLEWLHAQG